MANRFRRIFDAIFDTIDDVANHDTDRIVIIKKFARTTYSHDNRRIRTVAFVPEELRPYCGNIADEIQMAVDAIMKAHLTPVEKPVVPVSNTAPVVNTASSNIAVSNTSMANT